jgi:hypothetical protein
MVIGHALRHAYQMGATTYVASLSISQFPGATARFFHLRIGKALMVLFAINSG